MSPFATSNGDFLFLKAAARKGKMSKIQQLNFLDTPTAGAKQEVIYTPVPADVIDKYAHAVCREYSEKHLADCNSTEFVQGFRSFVRAIAQVKTIQLNKGGRHAKQSI